MNSNKYMPNYGYLWVVRFLRTPGFFFPLSFLSFFEFSIVNIIKIINICKYKRLGITSLYLVYYPDIITKNASYIGEKMGKLCIIFLGFDPFTVLVTLVIWYSPYCLLPSLPPISEWKMQLKMQLEHISSEMFSYCSFLLFLEQKITWDFLTIKYINFLMPQTCKYQAFRRGTQGFWQGW